LPINTQIPLQLLYLHSLRSLPISPPNSFQLLYLFFGENENLFPQIHCKYFISLADFVPKFIASILSLDPFLRHFSCKLPNFLCKYLIPFLGEEIFLPPNALQLFYLSCRFRAKSFASILSLLPISCQIFAKMANKIKKTISASWHSNGTILCHQSMSL